MGMLMHHTWLKEQQKTVKPVAEPVEKTTEEPKEPETAKKTAGRRKTNK